MLRRVMVAAGVLGLVLLGLVPAAAWAADSTASETIYVQVRSSKVRSQPKHWASGLRNVKYGDKLEMIGEQEGWLRVRSGKQIGYIHASAVTPKQIVLSSLGSAADQRADQSDVVLAGKGFSREVEREYAYQNPDLNFSAVNEMERQTVSDQELRSFLKEGRLSGDS